MKKIKQTAAQKLNEVTAKIKIGDKSLSQVIGSILNNKLPKVKDKN